MTTQTATSKIQAIRDRLQAEVNAKENARNAEAFRQAKLAKQAHIDALNIWDNWDFVIGGGMIGE